MVFKWNYQYSVQYDTRSWFLDCKDVYVRVDSYNEDQDTYLVIYDGSKIVKSSDFSSVELAKKWVERWYQLEFLLL